MFGKLDVRSKPQVTAHLLYVHKVDAQRINIKWQAQSPPRLALAEYPLTLQTGLQLVNIK